MNLKIRQPLENELERIADYQVDMAWETESFRLDKETVKKGVKHVYNNPAIGCYWVAEVDGKMAGALLTLYEWSDWRNSQLLWVHSLYVETAFRQKGIFKTMYTLLQEEVKSRDDLAGIRLYVDKTNLKAQKVYEAIGMTKEHYELYEWMK